MTDYPVPVYPPSPEQMVSQSLSFPLLWEKHVFHWESGAGCGRDSRFADWLNDGTVWVASYLLSWIRFGLVRGKGEATKKEHS